MITEDQRRLIETLQVLLQAEPNVEAAWLAGSLGAELGDEFSDVDILVLARENTADDVSSVLAGELDRAIKPVLVTHLFGGRVLSVVTQEWSRFDLSMIEPADLARQNGLRLKSLFNHGNLNPPFQQETPYQTSQEQLLALVREFLRVLGLAAVGIGRGEYVVAMSGIGYLRGMTVDLMLEENAVPTWKRGGALRRNPLLTAEQIVALEALPSLRADKESVTEGNQALAALFIPRARRLAEKIAMPWPDELELATRRHLETKLGWQL